MVNSAFKSLESAVKFAETFAYTSDRNFYERRPNSKPYRECLWHPIFSDGHIVATDTHRLVAIPCDEPLPEGMHLKFDIGQNVETVPIQGTFPNWQRVVPHDSDICMHITFDARTLDGILSDVKKLKPASNRIAIKFVSRERVTISHAVNISDDPKKTINALQPIAEEIDVSMIGNWPSDAESCPTLYIDYRYLKSCIRVKSRGATVTIGIQSDGYRYGYVSRAITISQGDGIRYVVMPMARL